MSSLFLRYLFLSKYVPLIFLFSPVLLYAESDLTGRVVGIADGDTVTVLVDKKTYRIRLASIDAPEKQQAFYTVSKSGLADFIFNREVTISWDEYDRYQRIVGTIFLGDQNINEAMVRSGFAWWFRRYDENAETLKRLEAEARTSERGLWAEQYPVPPWLFRRGIRPSQAVVKKSKSGVCHIYGTKHFSRLRAFRPFENIKDCLNAGGRPLF